MAHIHKSLEERRKRLAANHEERMRNRVRPGRAHPQREPKVIIERVVEEVERIVEVPVVLKQIVEVDRPVPVAVEVFVEVPVPYEVKVEVPVPYEVRVVEYVLDKFAAFKAVVAGVFISSGCFAIWQLVF